MLLTIFTWKIEEYVKVHNKEWKKIKYQQKETLNYTEHQTNKLKARNITLKEEGYFKIIKESNDQEHVRISMYLIT